ncbi:Hypothetical predicted protein, partial [Paramuricea clavata]
PTRIPGEISRPVSLIRPASFADQLKIAIENQKREVTPTKWHLKKSENRSLPPALLSCSEVLLRDERKLQSLRPKYLGPFRVLDRSEKTFKIQLPSGPDTVSVDR